MENKKINRRSACHECPFKRSSEKGLTTHDVSRRGTLEACGGLIHSLEDGNNNVCHLRMREEVHCVGNKKVHENKINPNKHKDYFNNVDELIAHHVTKEKECLN